MKVGSFDLALEVRNIDKTKIDADNVATALE